MNRLLIGVFSCLSFWSVCGSPLAAQEAAAAMTKQLRQTDLAAPLRKAMLQAVSQQPQKTRWSGSAGERLFGLAVRKLPQGSLRLRAAPLMLDGAGAFAVQEMLLQEAVLQNYSKAGLTDHRALRQAILQVSGQLNISARVRGADHGAELQDDFAAAWVAVDRKQLTARLLDPPQLKILRPAYRQAIQRRMRAAMQTEQWPQALALHDHLEQCKLLSLETCLLAARCHHRLKEPQQSARSLRRAWELRPPEGGVEKLEALGDAALELDAQAHEKLAEQIFTEALRRFQSRRSPSPKKR